jgi:hypothetical protein
MYPVLGGPGVSADPLEATTAGGLAGLSVLAGTTTDREIGSAADPGLWPWG